MSYFCESKTLKSLPCKNKINFGKYCKCHQQVFYCNAPEWPSITRARRLIKLVNNEDKIYYFLKNLLNNNKLTGKCIVIVTSETLLKYRDLIYGSEKPSWQRLIKTVIEKLNEFDHLNDYVENFKNKLLIEHRLPAQQRYIVHIFKNVVNYDCATVIASFI